MPLRPGIQTINQNKGDNMEREVRQSIGRMRERLDQQQIPTPEERERKAGVLQRIFQPLRFLETAPYVMAAKKDKSLLGVFGRQAKRIWNVTVRGKQPEWQSPVQRKIDTATYSDVFDDYGWEAESTPEKVSRAMVGLGLDILLDPKTYLTLGVGRAAKLFVPKRGLATLSKTGQRMLNKATAHWGTEAGRESMAALVHKTGNKYLSKTGVKFMGKEILPRSVLKAPLKTTDDIIKKMPYAGRAYKATKGLVRKTTDTIFAPFDKFRKLKRQAPKEVVDSMQRLEKGLVRKTKGALNRDLKTVQNFGQKLIKEQGEDIPFNLAKMMERGGKVTGDDLTDTFLKWAANRNDEYLKGMRKMLEPKGIKVGKIDDYVGHFLTKKGKKFLEQDPNNVAGFYNTLKAFSRSKPGSAKGRKIVRIISEAGDDVSFKGVKHSLKPIQKSKVIDSIEDIAKKKVGRLQKIQRKLANPEVEMGLKEFKDHIAFLKQHVVKMPGVKKAFKGVDDVSEESFQKIVKSIVNIEKDELATTIKELEQLIKTTQGKAFLTGGVDTFKKLSRKAKAVDLEKKIMKIQDDVFDKLRKMQFFDFTDAKGNFYKKVMKGKYKGVGVLDIDGINKKMKPLMEEAGINLKKGEGFFEPNMFKALAKQTAEYHRTLRNVKYYDEIFERFGIRMNQLSDAQQESVKGIGKFVDGGMEYVKPKLKFMGKQMEGDTFLPSPIVKHIKKARGFMMGNEKEVGKILKAHDKALSFFKRNVTGYFPAFHTRNFFGGFFNNWLAGTPVKRYKDAAKVINYKKALDKGKDVADEVIELGGKKFKYSKIIKMAEDSQIFGQPGVMDVMRGFDEQLRTLEKAGTLKKAKYLWDDIPSKGFEFVENHLRLPLFMERLGKGESAQTAAKWVYKYHFDYAPEALTGAEKSIVKRVIPFYTWVRNNTPLQFEQLAKQPGKYAMVDKARREIEAMTGTEKVANERKHMPDWMREMFTIRLPWVKNSGEPYYLQVDLPLEDLNKLSVREIMSLTSPLLKYPIERYFNKSFYFDSEIYNKDLPKEYQVSQTIDILKKLPKPVKDFLNIQEVSMKNYYNGEFEKKVMMDSRKLHFVRSLWFSRWYSTFAKAMDKDANMAEKMTRLVGGEPLRPLHIGRSKWRNLKNKEAMYRDLLYYMIRTERVPYKGEEKDFTKGSPIPKETLMRKIGKKTP